MIIRVQMRHEDGRYTEAVPSIFASSAFAAILEHGWDWLRDRLGEFCVSQAVKYSSRSETADLWYRRYQQIRGIE